MGLKLLGPTGSHIGVYRRSRGLGFRVWALGLLVVGSLGFEDFLCGQLSSASARYPPKEPLRIKTHDMLGLCFGYLGPNLVTRTGLLPLALNAAASTCPASGRSGFGCTRSELSCFLSEFVGSFLLCKSVRGCPLATWCFNLP